MHDSRHPQHSLVQHSTLPHSATPSPPATRHSHTLDAHSLTMQPHTKEMRSKTRSKSAAGRTTCRCDTCYHLQQEVCLRCAAPVSTCALTTRDEASLPTTTTTHSSTWQSRANVNQCTQTTQGAPTQVFTAGPLTPFDHLHDPNTRALTPSRPHTRLCSSSWSSQRVTLRVSSTKVTS